MHWDLTAMHWCQTTIYGLNHDFAQLSLENYAFVGLLSPDPLLITVLS